MEAVVAKVFKENEAAREKAEKEAWKKDHKRMDPSGAAPGTM